MHLSLQNYKILNCDLIYWCPLYFLNMSLCWVIWQAKERQWIPCVDPVSFTLAHLGTVEIITMQARYSVYFTTWCFLLNPFCSTPIPQLVFLQVMLATFIKAVQSPGRFICMNCSHTSDCSMDWTPKEFTPASSLISWDGRSCSRERTLWRRIYLVTQQDDQHCVL